MVIRSDDRHGEQAAAASIGNDYFRPTSLTPLVDWCRHCNPSKWQAHAGPRPAKLGFDPDRNWQLALATGTAPPYAPRLKPASRTEMAANEATLAIPSPASEFHMTEARWDHRQ